MAYTMIFDDPHKLIRVSADGSEDMTVAVEAMHQLHSDPRFRPDYRILCDFRKQKYVPNTMDAAGISTLMRGFFSGQKFAFVISDPKHLMAQELLLASTHSEVTAKVFSELSAAETWLMNQ